MLENIPMSLTLYFPGRIMISQLHKAAYCLA